MRTIGRILLKLMIGIVQIPLTVIYFIFSFLGGALSGIGYICGVIIFIATLIFWIFGVLDAWWHVLVGMGIAAGVAFGPVMINELGGEAILKLKGLLASID